MKTAERRQNLREALIAAAERSIDAHGLTGIRARDLAAEVGCAVGAIYNVVADLDELVFAVHQRTLIMLEAELAAAGMPLGGAEGGRNEAIAQLVRMALTYLHFAAAHTRRWRAVFDHQLPEGTQLPGAYREQQQRLFSVVEQPLRVLQPNLGPEESALLARSLFSAVHGMAILGLEAKLGTISLHDLEQQITAILTALGTGLSLRAEQS